MVDIHQNR